MAGTNLTGYMRSTHPSLDVERQADQMRDLLIVPPMTWQASLLIHRRKLAVYS